MLSTRKILTIDIGNTAAKVCVFEGEELLETIVGDSISYLQIEALIHSAGVEGVACCCVGEDKMNVIPGLSETAEQNLLVLNSQTPLPIEVHYSTRATLGADRLAAAVGVACGGENKMIVDAGTAVTIDIVEGLKFAGGNISPGLKLRFRSLHDYTSRLPLVTPAGDIPDFGYDTHTAIRSGVMRGLAGEIAAAYHRASDKYDNLKLILAGGDAPIIEPLLQQYTLHSTIDTDAVGRGLVRIFNYNNSL